jgi:chloramphenicol O-acetyltransferase type A
MKKVNIESWNRKQTFEFFKDMDQPKYTITVDLDVTDFYKYVKKKETSFYFAMMYVVMIEMNAMENMKYRFYDNEVILCDQLHPSFTDTIPLTAQFKIVTADMKEDMFEFIKSAKEASEKQGSLFIDMSKEQRPDLVYITTFPWAKFTQVSHAHQYDHQCAIQRVAWGKFEEIDGRLKMPFSIEAHHAFVDGLHVGIFINRLQERLLASKNLT